MFTNLSKIPIKLAILLVGFGLLVAGCDSSSSVKEKPTEISYEVTNDLGDRLTTSDASASGAAAATQAKSTSFELVAQVTPPDVDNDNSTTERASHVTYSESGNNNDGNLYVGYALRGDGPGNGFNGGTDVINVDDPSNPVADPGSGANALQVENVDVQEGVVDKGLLFLGVAEDPSSAGEVGSQPAEVHSIELTDNGYPNVIGGEVQFEDRDIPANLVKSVSKASSGDGTYEFYAVTDTETFYRFDVGGGNPSPGFELVDTRTAAGAQLRGVASTPDGGFALGWNDQGADDKLYGGFGNTDVGAFGKVKDLGEIDFFSRSSIARVTSHTYNGGTSCELVFTALNNSGFRVFEVADDGSVTKTSSFAGSNGSGTYPVTSVTGTDDYVYVATGEEIGVFDVNDDICESNNDGLRKIGQAPVEDFLNADKPGYTFANSGAQVNQVVAWSDGTDDYLGIAMGRNGVFVATQGGTYP